jgi:hypothetical protein
VCNFHRSPGPQVPSDTAKMGADIELGRRYLAGRPDEELYDLQGDPDEMKNLVGKQEMGELLQQMRRRLADWMVETDDPLRHGPIASPTYKRNIERLFGSS